MSELKPGAVTMAEIRAAYPALAALAEGTLSLPRLDPEAAEWLDGKWFCKWLSERFTGRLDSAFGDAIARRHSEWKRGAAVSLAHADVILTHLGYHVHDLPDEMWVRPPYECAPGRFPSSSDWPEEEEAA